MTSLDRCSACEGKDGWCQAGENVGFPCQEDCPEAEDEGPNCDDDSCKAPQDSKTCSQGPQQGCACKRESPCPDPMEDGILRCGSAECGGAVTPKRLSTCVGDENGRFKDCQCKEDIPSSDLYGPFDELQLVFQQQVLDDLAPLNDAVPSPSSSSALSSSSSSSTTSITPSGTATLTCSPNNVAFLPHGFRGQEKTLSRNEIPYALREVLCSNRCERSGASPPGIRIAAVTKGTQSGCELSVVLQGGLEAVRVLVSSFV